MKSNLSFCVKCKKKTSNKNIKIKMINGHKMQKSICTICGSKKTTFLPNNGSKSQKDSGPYQVAANLYRKTACDSKARPLLDGEKHYGCHNYSGPGTRIDLPEVRNFKPYNNIDACSRQHDIDYFNSNKDPKKIKEADEKVLQCYDKYPNENGYKIAKLGIKSKTKLENTFSKSMKSIIGKYYGSTSGK